MFLNFKMFSSGLYKAPLEREIIKETQSETKSNDLSDGRQVSTEGSPCEILICKQQQIFLFCFYFMRKSMQQINRKDENWKT